MGLGELGNWGGLARKLLNSPIPNQFLNYLVLNSSMNAKRCMLREQGPAMVSRRAFLRMTSAAGTAAYALRSTGLEEVLAASAQVAGRSAETSRRTNLSGAKCSTASTSIARSSTSTTATAARVRPRCTRRSSVTSISRTRPRCATAGSWSRTRSGAPSSGRGVWLRPRGARHHAQFERSAADCSERSRSQTGR